MDSLALNPPAPAPRRFPWLVVACLAATWLVWGSTYLAIKFALRGFAPFFQMGTRFVAAGLVLMAWMHWRGAAWPDRVQWRHAFLVGTLMLGGGMGGTAYAEQSVGSGLVVAFIAVSPMMIALASLPFGVRPRGTEWAGIAVGVAGVLMLVRGQGFAASPAGLVAQSLACLGWAVGSVLSRFRYPLADGAMGFASEMLCGGIVLLGLSWLTSEPWTLQAPVEAWLAWLYLVVFGSLIAFNAYMVLLARASGTVASSYSFVNPVIAMGLGVTLGGEHITGFEWAAVAVVLAGVVLLLWRRG